MLQFPKSVIFMGYPNCKKQENSQFSENVFRNQTLLIYTGMSIWKLKSESPVSIIYQSENH